MGTTLEGKQINQTYQGLLKTTDNNEVGVDAKEITDGKGNGTGVTLDNSGNVVANATVTANAFVGDGSQLTNVPNDVTSVNTQTGDVVLDTDDIAEGSNQYYTDARVEANTAVATNTAKVGITQSQADAIVLNSAKNSYPAADALKLSSIEDNADITDATNVTSGLVSATSISESDKATIRSNIGAGGATSVSSVNGQTGTVVLDADDISDTDTENKFTSASDITKLSGIESGAEVNPTSTDELTEGTTNLYYTEARTDARVDAQTGANLDLSQRTTSNLNEGTNLYYTEARVSANTDVAANTAKVGITSQQAADIVTNNAKVGITTQQATDITTNNAKVGITPTQATEIAANTLKVGITTEQSDAIIANTAKNSYPSADATKVSYITVTQAVDLDTLESDVATNNAKVGITTQQADEIAANTLKTGITAQQASDITANNAKVSMVLGTIAGTALEGDTDLLQLGTTATTALAGNTTTITAQQATDITTNNSKVGITTQQAADIVTNNAKVGITTQQASDITANNAKISFDSASSTKLAGIAEGAEVNVNADWNATTGDAQILNKPSLATVATTGAYSDLSGTPSLATVATSGSYTDLSNTPTIPTNNNELTNGAGYITDGNTGWNNTYGFITASTTDTLTNKSGSNNQWTNDAGYINEAAQTLHTNAIGNAIDFSARVTLDGGVAEGTSGIIKNLQSIS